MRRAHSRLPPPICACLRFPDFHQPPGCGVSRKHQRRSVSLQTFRGDITQHAFHSLYHPSCRYTCRCSAGYRHTNCVTTAIAPLTQAWHAILSRVSEYMLVRAPVTMYVDDVADFAGCASFRFTNSAHYYNSIHHRTRRLPLHLIRSNRRRSLTSLLHSMASLSDIHPDCITRQVHGCRPDELTTYEVFEASVALSVFYYSLSKTVLICVLEHPPPAGPHPELSALLEVTYSIGQINPFPPQLNDFDPRTSPDLKCCDSSDSPVIIISKQAPPR